MLKKYLESQRWLIKNESQIDAEIRERFDELSEYFDAWVAAQPVAEQSSIEAAIVACSKVFRVFYQCKVVAVNVPGRKT